MSFADHLTITWPEVASVVLATTVLYLVVAFVVHLWGHLLYGSPSPLRLAVVMLLGPVAGRAALGDSPRLIGGLVMIATVIILEWLLQPMSRAWRSHEGPGRRRAVVVMSDGEVETDQLRRNRVSRDDLWTQLRKCGVRQTSEVRLAILETDGSLTCIRVDEQVDACLLEDIKGFTAPREGLT